MLLPFLLVLSLTWMISLNQTNGWIELRYENKNHLGVKKDDVTTGRGELFQKEIEGFLSNPFLGIGFK